MMDRIANSVERDPTYQARIHFTQTRLEPTTADALAGSARQIAQTVSATAMVCYTQLGSDSAAYRARAAAGAAAGDERIASHLAPAGTAVGRPLPCTRATLSSFEEMVEKGKRMALRHQIAKGGDRIVLMAGIPFGTAGSTNVLHVVRLIGDELDRYHSSGGSAGH